MKEAFLPGGTNDAEIPLYEASKITKAQGHEVPKL
jgi:hypothetical protein